MSKYTPYTLQEFNVERRRWGNSIGDVGEYEVKITYRDGKNDSFTITLPENKAAEIANIIADIICEGANQLRSDIFKSFGRV